MFLDVVASLGFSTYLFECYTVHFIYIIFGSLFWLPRVPVGSLFNEKLGLGGGSVGGRGLKRLGSLFHPCTAFTLKL